MVKRPLFEKVTQLVTVTFPAHPSITYTMVLRRLGIDGSTRAVYVGNCEIHDSKDGQSQQMFVAAVFRTNGTLYAACYWDKMDEAAKSAGRAIMSKRRAYGKGHSNIYDNFDTYREGETVVDGYKIEDNA